MIYAQWLHSIEGVGAAACRKMTDAGLRAQDVYRMNGIQLHACGIFTDRQIDAILKHHEKDPQAEWEKLSEAGIRFLTLEEGDYPGRLRRIRDAPYGLYLIGKLPDERRLSAAVVGARECTTYGAAVSKKIGKELSESGVTVVSGMARGIDGCAHRGALSDGGDTFAVLGCGIDTCYPTTNRDLYHDIPLHGGIFSEFPPGVQPLPIYFPMRNRIISGLSDCVVVVEARKKSGSLITAELAMEQGRDVYAVPGPIDSSLSYGCHHLIHQGAGIWVSTAEFLHDKSLDFAGYTKNETVRMLEKSEGIVYSAIVLLPKSIEEIKQETGTDSRQLMKILLDLQIKGLIAEIGKGRYIRLHVTDPEEDEEEGEEGEANGCVSGDC